MRIATCGRGTSGVMRALWPLVILFCAMSCAVTSHEVDVADSAAVGEGVTAKDAATVAAVADDSIAETEIGSAARVEEEWLRLRGTSVEALGSTHRLVFDLSRSPDSVSHFQLPKPPRVVLDLHGPHNAARAVDRYQADDPLVERVRVGHYSGRMRLVIDLKEELPEAYYVRTEGGALVVYLGELGEEGLPTQPEVVVEQHGGESSASKAAPTATAAVEVSSENPEAAIPTWPEPNVEETDLPETVATSENTEPVEPRVEVDLTESGNVPEIPEPAEPRMAKADPPKVDPQKSVDEATPTKLEPELSKFEAVQEESTGIPRLAKLTSVEKMKPAERKVYTGKRISLDFKDADVQNILRVLADVSRLNIVATDDVEGRVTLHLKDVPWDQALDIVLDANRLKMIREGNVIRVSTIERVREEQEALRLQQNAEKELEPLGVRYVRVNYARADDALVEKVQGVLTDRGSASFDERTNTVILRDIRRGVDDAIELIRNLDIQSPQVLIEANLVEASTDFARALGVQWGYRHLAGPMTGNPMGGNFPGTMDVSGSGLGTGASPPPAGGGAPQPSVPFLADFPVPSNFGPGFGPGGGSALNLALGSLSGSDTLSARLTALEEEGKGKIISRPRVITLNNIPARIESLTILRVKLPDTGTVLNTGAGGVAGTASTATEKIETGIILVVTPQVSSDGYVLLNIRAKSSQADFSRQVDEIPVEVSREATSNVLIRDSETVVLGGIFRNEVADTETGVPYLRSIPVLGWLFKRTSKRDRKEELLVFITPQVVAGYGAELPSASQLWRSRMGS